MVDTNASGAMTGQVKMLCEMGFPQTVARKALDRTNWDVEAAAEWCIAHCEEDIPESDPSENTGNSDNPAAEAYIIPDYDDDDTGKNEDIEFEKITFGTIKVTFTEEEFESRKREYEAFVPEPESIIQLEFLGIGHALAKKALRICRGDIERSADWAFNNWNSPTEEDDETVLLEQTRHVQNQISDLQKEGEEILKQMVKEKSNPTTDFVTEMVEKLEGRRSKTSTMSGLPTKPRAMKQRARDIQSVPDPSGSPTTQALRDLMADLGTSPLVTTPQYNIPFQPTPPQNCSGLLHPQIPTLLVTDDSDYNPVSEAEFKVMP